MSTQSTCTQTARLPKLVPVTQRFSDEQIPDLSAALHAQFQRQEVSAIIRPGQSVALLLGPGALPYSSPPSCRPSPRSFLPWVQPLILCRLQVWPHLP